MLADPRYLVKFYGFTSDDAKAFCRDLAEVLGMTPERAWDLLLEAPVVVREGEDREDAESLANRLRAIQALCIVEPVHGNEHDEGAGPRLPESKPQKPDEGFSEGQLLHYRIWLGMVLAVSGILVVFGISAYLVSYSRLYRSHEKPVQLPTSEQGTPAESAEARPAESVHQLKDKIDVLDEELKDLTVKLRLMEEEVKEDSRSQAVDPIRLRGQKQVLHGRQMEVAQLRRQLRELRSHLAEIESAQSQRP
jgi:hypothetical protein